MLGLMVPAVKWTGREVRPEGLPGFMQLSKSLRGTAQSKIVAGRAFSRGL